jgi:hypothetical protein
LFLNRFFGTHRYQQHAVVAAPWTKARGVLMPLGRQVPWFNSGLCFTTQLVESARQSNRAGARPQRVVIHNVQNEALVIPIYHCRGMWAGAMVA